MLRICKNSHEVSVATVTRKMLQSSAIKLNVAIVGSLVKYVTEMGTDGVYLDELSDHHAMNVNPTVLCVSHNTFEAIVVHIDAKYILFRLGSSCALYSDEKVEPKVRPQPDVSRLFSPSDFMSLAKNTEALEKAETYLKGNRTTFIDVLAEHAGLPGAKAFVRKQEIQVVRMVSGKGALPDYTFGTNATAKLDERLKVLHQKWLKYVTTQLPASKLFELHGDPEADGCGDTDRWEQIIYIRYYTRSWQGGCR